MQRLKLFFVTLVVGAIAVIATPSTSSARSGPDSTCWSCIFRSDGGVYCDESENGDQYGGYSACTEIYQFCEDYECWGCALAGDCHASPETSIAMVSASGAVAVPRFASVFENEPRGDSVDRGCNGTVVDRSYAAATSKRIDREVQSLTF
jgi:hypothetical protein